MKGSLLRPVSGPGNARVDVVGLSELRGGRRWRVDVVEVKGTTADARREQFNLGPSVRSDRSNIGQDRGGKWWRAAHLSSPQANYWLAVDAFVDPKSYARLPGAWGLLVVDGYRVERRRLPSPDAARAAQVTVEGPDAAWWLWCAARRRTFDTLPPMRFAVEAARALDPYRGVTG